VNALRLMGGYQPGNDIELDQAVNLVPKIYKSMLQSPQSPRSDDAFRDLAEALQPGSDDLRSLSALFRPDMPPPVVPTPRGRALSIFGTFAGPQSLQPTKHLTSR